MKFLKTISSIFIPLSVFVSVTLAQQYTLRGTVTDEAGKPLVGLNVVEKGTRHGTSTNNDGKYSLTYSSPDATIVFSMVGYKKQEIKAEARTELNVMMVEGLELGEVLVVGSRSMNRSVIETAVPVDVLDLAELNTRLGQFDVNQVLQYVAPSFNANRQSGADGADHIDPASLRGLGPDQTLVLINGKRRHQSSLINIFGSRGRGNTGTDLNAIPAGAIERIEILRDGASAQYGSDAIAGVVNAVLKSTVNEFTGSVSTGVHQAKGRPDRDYDGEEFQVSGNYGIPVGNGGSLNMTMDYLRKGRTNRPADPTVYSIYRKQFGDAALQNYGAFLNLRVPVSERVDVYGFGGFNYRSTDAFAWTRDPDSERNVPAIYPNGFDPHITSKITDPSLSVGLRTNLGSWNVDLNNTFGLNRFHYTIKGTLNASLQERSPTQFDAGGFQLWQNTAGVNFTRFFSEVENGLNVAFGLEYRLEDYEIFAGEEGSWKSYGGGLPAGSQGFPGFRPANVLDETRTNVGAYADVELDVTKQFMVGGAARFENYSDFGSTVNVKAASRLKLSDEVALRGSVSTGFRAPSLAQIFFNSTFTDFVAGVPIDKFIAKNNSPLTHALGIPELKEETAQNASVGLTANLPGGFTATIDGYYVKIKDRIVLTGAFGDDDPDIGPDLQALGVGAAQFFTNALDTRTFGLDVIATYTQNIEGHQLRFSLAGNFNDMELGAIKTSPKLRGKEDIYFGRREQHFLLASAPKNKMSATVDYSRDRFHGSLRVVRFGKVTLIDWLDTEDIYEAKVTTDLSLAFDMTKNTSLVVGSANLFNEYPSQQDTETETGGLWDAVQMGFAGRFYYARVNFRF